MHLWLKSPIILSIPLCIELNTVTDCGVFDDELDIAWLASYHETNNGKGTNSKQKIQ